MQVYETDILTRHEKDRMLEWFNESIGTEYEVNEDPSGEPNKYYIMFFDLEYAEVDLLRSWETALDMGRK